MAANGQAPRFLTQPFTRVFTPVLLTVTLWSGCASQDSPANLAHEQAASSDTPLITAVTNGDLERVQQLSEQGAALNTLTEDGTPLARAVNNGEDQIAWYLLSRGADPDYAGAAGVTPLMIAAGNGERRLVQLLLSAGADVNADSRSGLTPVLLAAREGHLAVVKVLVGAGANVNVTQNGRSLLMHVVAGGDLLTAETVIAAGADVNYRAGDGTSALDLARAAGNQDIEMLLIQAGADT